MNQFDGLSVQELDMTEKRTINGGVFGLDDLLIGIAVGAAVQVLADWDNFKAGLMGQPQIK